MKRPISLLLLTIGVLAMPGRSRADSFTFSISGNSQQGTATSFSLSTTPGPLGMTIKHLTIVTPLADPLVPVLFGDVGTSIQSVIIDAFNTLNGVPTLVGTLEFDNDFVVSVVDSASQPGDPIATVTFNYQTETTTVIGGGGGSGPSPTPEPSSLLLLGAGLLGLWPLTRRRYRN
jgi:hypothetical protein